MENFIVLSLGSNEGDRKHNLNLCVSTLKKFISVEKISSIYESDALLLPNSPTDWNKNFYNICLSGKTNLQPLELLKKVKEIELEIAGAKRELRWSPRAIDIDIVAYNSSVLDLQTDCGQALSIPHKSMQERTFVVWPLAEILPNWQHPQSNKTAFEIAQNFGLKFPEELGVKISPLNTKLAGGL